MHETRFSPEGRSKLFKLLGFLEQWRVEKLAEIFIKRDQLYQNPSFFNKQKHREALATLRTKEALQIYEIKKRARKIGLEFSEGLQIEEYPEKMKAIIAVTKKCANLEEWISLLEKENLLIELLKLAHSNMPPHYRCVHSGKLLFSAISSHGNFYDVNVFKELTKHEKDKVLFEHEYETSRQLYSAIAMVFREYFVMYESSKQDVFDCKRFLTNKVKARLEDIRALKQPEKENPDEDLFMEKEDYRSCLRSPSTPSGVQFLL